MAIIEAADLAEYLRRSIDGASAETAIRMAEGWLAGATRLDPWPPDPVGEDLWAWALELAVLAYTNPTGLASVTAGGEVTQWSDAARRRQEILDAARAAHNSQGRPVASFPPAQPWPEPAAGHAPGWGR